MLKNIALCLFIVSFIPLVLQGCSKEYDIVIYGGSIIDGTGEAGYTADIAIKDGKIVKIGYINASEGKEFIDAQGKILTPGFIDVHTHSDRQILEEDGKKSLNYLKQGVTTLVTGNCGSGRYGVSEYFADMEEQGIGTNIIHLIGHGTLRREVMGSADRAPNPDELEQMKSILERGMQDGASGFSTGLFYTPGSFAETEEIIELCGVVKKHQGLYASHLRDESNYTTGLIASVKEAIEIGEKAGVPVEISHIKALGKPVWGLAEEVCGLIESARERGVTVYADQYPYNASSTSLSAAVIPERIKPDGKMRERLRDTNLLPGIRKEISANIERRGGPETLVVSSFKAKPEWEGKSLLDISEVLNVSPADAAIELVLMGGPGIISFNMNDEDIEYFMSKPYVMTGSDGSNVEFGKNVPHPRSYGTFPRKIRLYVKEKQLLTMEQAIRSSTGLPAEMLGLRDRGMIKEQYIADIVIFHYSNITDRATFTEPHQYSEGIEYLIVNGELVIDNGEFNGKLAGRPIKTKAGQK